MRRVKRKRGTSSTHHDVFYVLFKSVPIDSKHECTHIRVNVFDKDITLPGPFEIRIAAKMSYRLQLYTVLGRLAGNCCTIDALHYLTLPRTNNFISPVLPFCNAGRSQTTERMTKQYTNKSVAGLQVIIWTEITRWQQLNTRFQLHVFSSVSLSESRYSWKLRIYYHVEGAITWLL